MFGYKEVTKVTRFLLEVFVSLLFLASLTFLLLRLLPGGPFSQEANLHPLVLEQLQREWGLQGSIWQQWFEYMGALLQGHLGVSMMRPDQSVVFRLKEVLGLTLGLNLLALLICSLVAPCMAIYAFSSSRIANVVRQFCLLLISMPSLFLAPLLIWVFAIYWPLLPVAFLETPTHWILPVVALSLRPLAQLTRILMKSLEEQYYLDYVRAARAKGLSERQVLWRHVLPNSLVASLTYYPGLAVGLLSGSFIVELLFAIPGIGSEFVQSLAERDYTMISGIVLVLGVLFILFSTLSQYVVEALDPRLADSRREE